MADAIRLGTRASVLARTQSATVGDALAEVAGRPWVEVLVRTHGDDTSVPLTSGRPGLFVSTLRDALLVGDVDVIVHSYKDLPSEPVAGIVVAAVPVRADSRDALVSREGRRLADLPRGAIVGTSSPRRAAALLRMRPDLEVRPIRGNVDTRVAKVRSGEYDATVLAVAGLARIGRDHEITEVLADLLPAPAQGALAVECRAGDEVLREWLARLDDPDTRLTTSAERAVLVGVDAACTTAVAAQASIHGSTLRLRAELTIDSRHTDADVSVDLHDDPDPVLAAGALGLRAAGLLRGATPSARPVLLVRAEHDDPDAAALEARGVPVVSDPYLRRVLRPGGDDVERLLATLTAPAPGTWLVVTSPAAMPALADVVGEQRVAAAVATAVRRGVRAAATGARTADTLRSLGFLDVAVPRSQHASAAGVLELLDGEPAGTVLLPLGGQALRTLPDGLAARGWDVVEAVVYDTEPVAERPASALLLEAGQVAAVVLRSPSAVRALTGHARVSGAVRIVCAGPTTARAATEAGLRVDAVAASPDPAAVAAVVRG